MEVAMANEAVTTATSTFTTGGVGDYFVLFLLIILMGLVAYIVYLHSKIIELSKTLGFLKGYIKGLKISKSKSIKFGGWVV